MILKIYNKFLGWLDRKLTPKGKLLHPWEGRYELEVYTHPSKSTFGRRAIFESTFTKRRALKYIKIAIEESFDPRVFWDGPSKNGQTFFIFKRLLGGKRKLIYKRVNPTQHPGPFYDD